MAFINQMSSLTILYLSGNHSITDIGILKLTCPLLQYLDVFGCEMVTGKSLEPLSLRLPDLKIKCERGVFLELDDQFEAVGLELGLIDWGHSSWLLGPNTEGAFWK